MQSYISSSGADVITKANSSIDVQYSSFKKLGNVVIMYVCFGLDSWSGSWKEKKIGTINDSRYIPYNEGTSAVVSNQTGQTFDISITTSGEIKIYQRGISSITDDWVRGFIVYFTL